MIKENELSEPLVNQLKLFLRKGMIIFITGQSGAGKDVQADLLVKTFASLGARNVSIINTGDLFRNDTKPAPFFRDYLAKIQNSGGLQSAVHATSHWAPQVKENYFPGKPLIVVGSPRSMEEAKHMESFFEGTGVGIVVLCLIVSDTTAGKRIEFRNKEDASKGEQRTDTDDAEKVARKIKYFHDEVIPGLEYLELKKSFTVYSVDCEDTIPAIHTEILKLLGTFHGN